MQSFKDIALMVSKKKPRYFFFVFSEEICRFSSLNMWKGEEKKRKDSVEKKKKKRFCFNDSIPSSHQQKLVRNGAKHAM